jgi:SAM-dependent methyltransferase
VFSLTDRNPTGRFSGLADVYARCRPGYPDDALERIQSVCGVGGVLADVGCGTGIASRLMAARGVRVFGIEPNDEMRRRAEETPAPEGAVPIEYHKGTAEATGLPDGSVTAVLAAQAFHWFDAAAALREFHRILRPHGWVSLLWNERDERDAFTAAYGAVLRTGPDAAAVEGRRGVAGVALLESPLFENGVLGTFYGGQELDEEGVLGRAFSASYAPKEPAAVEAFGQALRSAFAAYQREGKVTLCYETSLYLARRRERAEGVLHEPEA